MRRVDGAADSRLRFESEDEGVHEPASVDRVRRRLEGEDIDRLVIEFRRNDPPEEWRQQAIHTPVRWLHEIFPIDEVLALVAYLVALVSAATVLVAIYNSMAARRRDHAHDTLPGAIWLPGAGRGTSFDDDVQARLDKLLEKVDSHYACVLGHLMNNSYRLGDAVRVAVMSGTGSFEFPIYEGQRWYLVDEKADNVIKSGLVDAIRENFFTTESIAGVATAGIAHGALVADALELREQAVRELARTVIGLVDVGGLRVVLEHRV